MDPTFVTIDIGGTNSRFALATRQSDNKIVLSQCRTLKTTDYPSFADAWSAYQKQCPKPLPRSASIAIAAPVRGPVIHMTNGRWALDSEQIAHQLNLRQVQLCNDFGAMAYGVAALNPTEFAAVGGPDQRMPTTGVTTVVGAGTGFGVALLAADEQNLTVIETEGGHIQFAPSNEVEQIVHDQLSQQHSRVSIERVLCGGGLKIFASALSVLEGRSLQSHRDATAWDKALSDDHPRWRHALMYYLGAMGQVVGDLALSHGAHSVALVGGLSQRFACLLLSSDFNARFEDKGRYQEYMTNVDRKVAKHPQLGLLGAAAAFDRSHRFHACAKT